MTSIFVFILILLYTFIPNTELNSSMIICRSSMYRRVFFTLFDEYNGGRFNGGEGINLSNCRLSNRLWHTSFIFDTDNCINFRVWYSVNSEKITNFHFFFIFGFFEQWNWKETIVWYQTLPMFKYKLKFHFFLWISHDPDFFIFWPFQITGNYLFNIQNWLTIHIWCIW